MIAQSVRSLELAWTSSSLNQAHLMSKRRSPSTLWRALAARFAVLKLIPSDALGASLVLPPALGDADCAPLGSWPREVWAGWAADSIAGAFRPDRNAAQ